eukprot:TRINITY_DN4377_c0_g2_i1.p1 TRINITY_DN4377_c0_g2~~TRINITY_DN4377_c0_g2_i1.p1  ORF type:complete len:272 (+),score=42.85 TRINITY_DN4377_c0_g2_i1:45-860(+)
MGQLNCCARGEEDEEEEERSDVRVEEFAPRKRGSRAQWVYTVRHGEREDAVNDDWCKYSDRPYDPPLTADGRQQAKEVGQKLLERSDDEIPSVVVSSPYLRCLQTAAIIFHELKVGSSDEVPVSNKIIVHYDLGEVQDPRVLSSSEMPVFTEEGIEKSIRMVLQSLDEERYDEMHLPHVVLHGTPPIFPETNEQATCRYDQVFTTLPSRYNTVLVTHGVAIGRSVASISPSSVVYQADYCCMTARFAPTPSAQWQLASEPGDNGCSWSNDF